MNIVFKFIYTNIACGNVKNLYVCSKYNIKNILDKDGKWWQIYYLSGHAPPNLTKYERYFSDFVKTIKNVIKK